MNEVEAQGKVAATEADFYIKTHDLVSAMRATGMTREQARLRIVELNEKIDAPVSTRIIASAMFEMAWPREA